MGTTGYYLAMLVHEAGHRTARAVMAAALAWMAVAIQAAPALAAPQITLSPDAGGPGTRVTLTAVNFESYVGDRLSIFFNAAEIAASPVTVTEDGRFELLFDVPTDAVAGSARVRVTGPLGVPLAEAFLTVPETQILLDVSSGVVGTKVAATGQGFYAKAIVSFLYEAAGQQHRLGTAVASPTGGCDFGLTIPSGPAGPQEIVARDDHGNRAAALFTVLPRVTIEPGASTVGDTVTVRATGFWSGAGASVLFGDSPVTFVSTDATGSFETHFNVPVAVGGPHTVTVQDGEGNTGVAGFRVMSLASLGRTTGPVGTVVEVSGTGYAAGATVAIDYDGVPVAAAQADGVGAFSTQFVVPRSAGGLHDVGVDDGVAAFGLVFAMERAPPPPPLLIAPAEGAEATQPIVFLWRMVDDASLPVTYGLQVAADSRFSDVLLHVASVAGTSYTAATGGLPASLGGQELHWRVMSTDGASNEGQWSRPVAFRVASPGGLPLWAIGVLIAAGVAIAGLLVFRIVRETSY